LFVKTISCTPKNIIVILKYQSPADVYQHMYRSLSKYIVIPNGGHEILSTINVGFQSLFSFHRTIELPFSYSKSNGVSPRRFEPCSQRCIFIVQKSQRRREIEFLTEFIFCISKLCRRWWLSNTICNDPNFNVRDPFLQARSIYPAWNEFLKYLFKILNSSLAFLDYCMEMCMMCLEFYF
jgi:hypothetical protein